MSLSKQPSKSSNANRNSLNLSKVGVFKEVEKSSVSNNHTNRSSHRSKLSKSFVELTAEEEKYVVASSVCQLVVESALNTIYTKYLEKQTVYFVSHCSRLAWKALIDWKYQRKDHGGFGGFEKEMEDKEPEPSWKDSWAGNSILMAEDKDEASTSTLTESVKQPKNKVSLEVDKPSRASVEEPLSVENERRNTILKAREALHQTRLNKRTKQKSMEFSARGTSVLKAKSVEQSHELPPPVLLQPRHFPPPRVEVKYAVAPGARGVVPQQKPTTKTIRLRRPRTSI